MTPAQQRAAAREFVSRWEERVQVYGLSSKRVWTARELQDAEEKPEQPHAGGAWKSACAAVADEHASTRREREVLELLAKGYNAAYVEQALYISNHTVRSHMLNIYRKLEVHSRQELIDMVENAKR